MRRANDRGVEVENENNTIGRIIETEEQRVEYDRGKRIEM